MAKDVLPLVDACTSSTAQFPAYARERLQTTVRQTLGRPESAAEEPDRSLAWGWRWVFGLAAATAVVVIVALSIFRAPNAPVIQLAMLDTVGGTRGTDMNELGDSSRNVEGKSSPTLFQRKRTGSVGEKLAQWRWTACG